MEKLPPDIIINELLIYLDGQSVYNLGLVDKNTRNLLNDEIIWRKRFQTKLQLKLSEVPNNIDINDYKSLPDIMPDIIYRIKEIKSQYCLYVYQRGSMQTNLDLSPTTADSNYCKCCLMKKAVVQGYHDTAYVLFDNDQHGGMPEYIGKRDDMYNILEQRRLGNRIGKYWNYKNRYHYIIKD